MLNAYLLTLKVKDQWKLYFRKEPNVISKVEFHCWVTDNLTEKMTM